jgi:endonuclease/exonuclease/phosphatase family metal-dependent hydrolase
MKYLLLFLMFFSVVVKSQQLTVMTYNIRCGHCDDNNSNNWDSRKEILLSIIKKHNPDILGLQEIIPLQLTYLQTYLSDYYYYGTGRNADGSDEGCYIFYKKDVLTIDSIHSGTKWFSSTPEVPGSNDMGDLYKRIVTVARFNTKKTNKYFYHFNTHLTYIDSIQVRYIDFLSNLIKNRSLHEPFILTGDFNADELSPAIKKLKENFITEKLVDTYRQLDSTHVISTFNFFNGRTDGKKIDYIFIEADKFNTIHASCDSSELNGKYPSDHNSINAVLQFK